jgi:hypothetical protein
VWTLQDGYCLGPIIADAGTYFELSAPLGTESLARVSESRQLEGSAVALGLDASDDGLVTTGALYDRERGPCHLETEAGASEAVCIATSLARAGYYADAACTNPLVAVGGSDQPAYAAHRDPRSSCWSVVVVQEAWAATDVYARIDRACVAVPRPAGMTLLATSHEQPPPALARVRATSGDRLDVLELVDGAVRVPSTYVFDRDLGGDCTIEDRDGELVCVPHAPVTATTVFADAACGTPIDLAFVPTGACEPQHAFAARGDARYAIGAPYTLPFYELEPGDRCGTFEVPAGTVPHALGPALPVDAFSRATVMN